MTARLARLQAVDEIARHRSECEVSCEPMTEPSTFSLAHVAEVHLFDAPLVRVLAQVQFPRTPTLVTEASEETLAGLLTRYPVRRRGTQQMIAFEFGPGGIAQPAAAQASPSILTLSDAGEQWKVTLTETTITMETTSYDSRDDFCERMLELLDAVAQVSRPPILDRVGVRYIDQFEGAALDRIDQLVHPTLVGLVGAVDPSLTVLQSVTQSRVQVGDNEILTVSSGLLPAGMMVDPMIPVVSGRSWLLDIDMGTSVGVGSFDPVVIADQVRTFAEHAYFFFRFAVTNAFLEAYGADQ